MHIYPEFSMDLADRQQTGSQFYLRHWSRAVRQQSINMDTSDYASSLKLVLPYSSSSLPSSDSDDMTEVQRLDLEGHRPAVELRSRQSDNLSSRMQLQT